MASASALAVMMDGPSSVFLQVAEYKESIKCGSFMALSSSLGQILMQLHSGTYKKYVLQFFQLVQNVVPFVLTFDASCLGFECYTIIFDSAL